MSAVDDIRAAEAREAAARARLIATLKELQLRLNPKTLAREGAQRVADVGQQAVQSGTAVVRRNPAPLAGAVVVGALFVARHRIARLFRRKSPSTKDQRA